MKKAFFGVTTVFVGILLAFCIVTKRAEANRAIFVSGSQDEIETAKRLSYDVLRERAAQRPIGNADNYTVKRAEIDESRVAHTHFQQTVDGVPVWGGEGQCPKCVLPVQNSPLTAEVFFCYSFFNA